VIVEYIHGHKDQFGVEPIRRDLQVAPSTYYACRSRPASARSVSDAATAAAIGKVHADN
jgi:putative transposase